MISACCNPLHQISCMHMCWQRTGGKSRGITKLVWCWYLTVQLWKRKQGADLAVLLICAGKNRSLCKSHDYANRNTNPSTGKTSSICLFNGRIICLLRVWFWNPFPTIKLDTRNPRIHLSDVLTQKVWCLGWAFRPHNGHQKW